MLHERSAAPIYRGSLAMLLANLSLILPVFLQEAAYIDSLSWAYQNLPLGQAFLQLSLKDSHVSRYDYGLMADVIGYIELLHGFGYLIGVKFASSPGSEH